MRISDWSSDVCSSDLGARRFDPGALTILDELQFHIGDHAEYGDDHSPHVARRRHLWFKDAQRSSLFIKLMHQVQDIARGAAEPVEPQHDQFVAGVHKLHDRFQFRAPAPRGPRSGLGTDNFATCILEAANLDIQILVRGADAGIRSEEHTSELQSLMRISYAVFCLKKKNNKSPLTVAKQCQMTHTHNIQ